jgi:hypothetical protein
MRAKRQAWNHIFATAIIILGIIALGFHLFAGGQAFVPAVPVPRTLQHHQKGDSAYCLVSCIASTSTKT